MTVLRNGPFGDVLGAAAEVGKKYLMQQDMNAPLVMVIHAAYAEDAAFVLHMDVGQGKSCERGKIDREEKPGHTEQYVGCHDAFIYQELGCHVNL